MILKNKYIYVVQYDPEEQIYLFIQYDPEEQIARFDISPEKVAGVTLK